ncbi:MAG: MATE family efflux transporter [Lentisphaeria bacterium]|nr:MATE family efflux transporter [Lentisphaeria bacterium]
MSSVSKYQIDMTHGPLFGKVVLFSIPLMISNVMQVLFHVIDMIVIGRYAPHEAMAAVGSCGSLISTILSVFFGLSLGGNVLSARYIGARNRVQVYRSVHTAMATALYGGILLAAVGFVISRPILVLMETPASVLPKSTLYMQLYCLGIPLVLLNSFGAAQLRATGDTRRPMVYLVTAGFIKAGLNLFFVRGFHWDVAGVAVATLLSNVFASSLIVWTLTRLRDSSRLFLNKIRFHGEIFRDMLKIGVPAGVQGSLFGISNMLIQSTINSFGSKAMAGSAATGSLEGLVYTAFITYYHSVVSFVGQNHGAKKYKRIVRSIFICIGLTALTAIVVGWGIYLPGNDLLAIFNPDPEVIRWGMIRLKYLVTMYFLCAIMEVISGALRGLGHSLIPMIVTLLGACVFRIFWVVWVFPHYKTMENLLLSYGVSWVLVCLVNGTILYLICRKLFRDAAHPIHHPGFGQLAQR